jgi:hypothetical protein
MLYDLAQELPPAGSLLESIFLLVALRKREADVRQTEALVVAIAGAQSGQVDLIQKSLREYKNTVLPFLEAEKTKQDVDMKALLKHWADKVAFIVKPLWQASDSKRMHSQLRRNVERTQRYEQSRRSVKHRRI